jgi:hypothetical protein
MIWINFVMAYISSCLSFNWSLDNSVSDKLNTSLGLVLLRNYLKKAISWPVSENMQVSDIVYPNTVHKTST